MYVISPIRGLILNPEGGSASPEKANGSSGLNFRGEGAKVLNFGACSPHEPRPAWLAGGLEASGPPLWTSVLRQNFSRRAVSRILPAGGTETM